MALPYPSPMSCADRLRLLAHRLAESGWPRWITELLQYAADEIETRG